jgi:hypothetical protein
LALGRDGRRVALRLGDRRLEVRDLGGSSIPRFVASVGECHSSVDVDLGPAFLTVKVGKYAHRIRWDRSRMELIYNTSGDTTFDQVAGAPGGPSWTRPRRFTANAAGLPSDLSYGRRFTAGCTAYGLKILVDVFGQIVVCDGLGAVVCIFFVLRSKVAAWLPDGTRAGPSRIIGGASTPGGWERVGKALRAAQDLEARVGPLV